MTCKLFRRFSMEEYQMLQNLIFPPNSEITKLLNRDVHVAEQCYISQQASGDTVAIPTVLLHPLHAAIQSKRNWRHTIIIIFSCRHPLSLSLTHTLVLAFQALLYAETWLHPRCLQTRVPSVLQFLFSFRIVKPMHG